MSFVGLHTALSGIQAAQTGLDITSHNVANAHTDGYTRQRVDQTTRPPYLAPVGRVGTGVDVAGISRSRDAFLDARARTTSADFAWHDTTAQLLRRTESVLGEPEQGLTAQLGGVWDAFDDLALDPGETATRQQVLAALDSLASRVRDVAIGWDQLATDTGGRLDDAVREANDLLTRIAELNREIGDASLRDGSPNDLLDQRDLAVDRVSALLGATVSTGTDGMVSLRLPPVGGGAGVALVDGMSAATLSVTGGVVEATEDGGVPVAVAARAEVGALQTFITQTLPERFAALDSFVVDLAASLNAQHAAGTDGYGQPGGDLLTFDPLEGAARSLRVPAALLGDPKLIAAGGPGAVGLHDSRNAEALAQLRTAQGGGESFDARLTAFVVDLGARVASARSAADAQSSLAVAATVARQGMHGVSIDEEMVGLVTYQRALEAASRVMTTVDQALDVLINRTGIVGR